MENKKLFVDIISEALDFCGEGRYSHIRLVYKRGLIDGCPQSYAERVYLLDKNNQAIDVCSVNMDSLPAMLLDIGTMLLRQV